MSPAATTAAGPPSEPEAGAGRASEAPLGWTRGDTIRTTIAVGVALALLGTWAWLATTGGSGVGGRRASFALLAGAALGILFERGRFCFFCIFRDLFEHKNSRGAFSILTALIVGTLGYALVFAIRIPDPSGGTLPSDAHIAPVSLALVLAGLAFGLGLVISGGCIGGHLYRLGEGSLRALPALAGVLLGFGLGFASWNPIYSWSISGAPVPWLPTGNGYGLAVALQLAVLIGLGVLLLRWNPPVEARPARTIDGESIRRVVFFQRWPALLTGALVGLVGFLAYLRSEPLGVTSQLSSLTRTTLTEAGALPGALYGLDQNIGGCVALVVDTITANGWLIIGIVLASFAAALPGRRFGIERLSLRGGLTGLVGGIALGWGAVIGLGCTIGVFLSGTQAMALSGWVFAISVTAAAGVGFKLGLHRGT